MIEVEKKKEIIFSEDFKLLASIEFDYYTSSVYTNFYHIIPN
jgi:hypothetical protein